MSDRLMVAIISTLLYELVLTAVVLWGLPRLGIYLPLPGLVAMMLALGAGAIYSYRKGRQAVEKKMLVGLSTMVGSKAKAVTRLDPEGLVKIKGELWKAQSTGERIDPGEEVAVVRQDRLKLIVRKTDAHDLKGKE